MRVTLVAPSMGVGEEYFRDGALCAQFVKLHERCTKNHTQVAEGITF